MSKWCQFTVHLQKIPQKQTIKITLYQHVRRKNLFNHNIIAWLFVRLALA